MCRSGVYLTLDAGGGFANCSEPFWVKLISAAEKVCDNL